MVQPVGTIVSSCPLWLRPDFLKVLGWREPRRFRSSVNSTFPRISYRCRNKKIAQYLNTRNSSAEAWHPRCPADKCKLNAHVQYRQVAKLLALEDAIKLGGNMPVLIAMNHMVPKQRL